MRDLALLHGWAMNRHVWETVVPGLSDLFLIHNLNLPGYGTDGRGDTVCCRPMPAAGILDEWSSQCLSAVPSGAVWMGWSLGAMVALNAAHRAPGEIEALILVSATPKFVKSRDWENGVDCGIMRGFLEGFRSDYQRTLKRFALLQADRTSDARQLAKCLTESIAIEPRDMTAMQLGLEILEQVDLRSMLHRIGIPTYVIHGLKDRIVPYAAGVYLAENLRRCELVSLDTGHAPFLTRPMEFLEALPRWM